MTWLAAVTLLALYLRQTVMRRSVSDAWMMTAALPPAACATSDVNHVISQNVIKQTSGSEYGNGFSLTS